MTLRAFDFPTPMQTQPRRGESIVAPQALFSMNSHFIIDQSCAITRTQSFERLETDEARVRYLFQRILQRSPDDREIKQVGRFVGLKERFKPSRKFVNSAWPLVAQAFASLLADVPDSRAASRAQEESPLSEKPPHFPARVKRVIHLFMNGGPSQMDTFDPKPELNRLDGQPLPKSVKDQLQPTQRKRAGSK